MAENSVGGGDAHVTGQRQVEPAPQTISANGSDHRLGKAFDRAKESLANGGEGERRRGSKRAYLDKIGSGGEGPIAAGNDDSANLCVTPGLDEGALDLAQQRQGQAREISVVTESEKGDFALAFDGKLSGHDQNRFGWRKPL